MIASIRPHQICGVMQLNLLISKANAAIFRSTLGFIVDVAFMHDFNIELSSAVLITCLRFFIGVTINYYYDVH